MSGVLAPPGAELEIRDLAAQRGLAEKSLAVAYFSLEEPDSFVGAHDPDGRITRLIEFLPPASALDFFEAVHHVERVQQGGRYRYGAVHAFPAFFEAFHNDHLVSKIYPAGRDVEGL